MRSNLLAGALVLAGAVSIGFVAAAVELKETVVEKFGYTIKIPDGFALEGKIGNTTNWIRTGGASAAPAKSAEGDAPKKKGLGSKLKALGGAKAEESAPASGAGGGKTEAALMVYVNWTHMPDVSSKQMFDINKKSMLDKIKGPNPEYTDLKELKLKDGYGFSYKEVDKTDGTEIHRWHINAYGNKSAYTVGLTGTFEQFAEWGKTYEEVIASFGFVPLKG